MSKVYVVEEPISDELLAEIDEWTDAIITSQMMDWDKALGGYVPEPIPERFRALARAYSKGETTYSACVLAIGRQYET
tara:strand:+ start:2005 stop:2238 length:234 start_codon:yes stop_codon:yes gene_type:complete